MATFGSAMAVFFGSDRCGQRLQIHVSAYWNYAYYAFGAGIGHKRFEYLVLVKAKFGGGFDPIAVIHMVV